MQARNCSASAARLATQIIGVAEATQSQRLALAQTHFAGKTKRLLVFRQAAVDITSREIDIAAQVMDLGALGYELVSDCRGLGLVEHLQRRLLPVGDPQARRHPDPGLAPAHIVLRRVESHFEGLDRFRGVPGSQGVAAKAEHLGSCGRILRQFDASLDQFEHSFELKRCDLRLGGIEIGRRSDWIIGAIKMLGTQHQIRRAIPGRGIAVQRAAPDLQREL